MRRIRDIGALEILIAHNKTNFCRIALRYSLVPPKNGMPGEDGCDSQPCSTPSGGPLTREDFLNPECHVSRNALTIEISLSRN